MIHRHRNITYFFGTPQTVQLKFATNNVERMIGSQIMAYIFNGDTAAANALDDYEEGNWTPAMN